MSFVEFLISDPRWLVPLIFVALALMWFLLRRMMKEMSELRAVQEKIRKGGALGGYSSVIGAGLLADRPHSVGYSTFFKLKERQYRND